jgi:stage 0 sporulation regulatory protein
MIKILIRMWWKTMKNEKLMKELLANIDSKRKEMIKFARKVGFTSEKTVKCSQELDMYLNQYQLIFLKRTS